MDELTFQDVMDNIREHLEELPGKDIAAIYNKIFDTQIRYRGDNLWIYTD
ncbi:MAG: hypothetical protein ACYS7Y_31255 [Planctomycetota bacterium]|jgi:hypothetical protein